MTPTVSRVCGRAAACLLLVLPTASLLAQSTQRVSEGPQGQTLPEGATGPAISGDGRFVAFVSRDGTLVPGDTNGVDDVFVLDRDTATLVRASVTTAGVEGDGASSHPRLSANGRYVAFESAATNLAASDANGPLSDVFVKDLVTGALEHVSVDSAGNGGNDLSVSPEISADGSTVVFFGYATNFGAVDTNGLTDTFVHDRTTQSTACLSVGATGQAIAGRTASVSGDGRHVVFETTEQVLGLPATGPILVVRLDRQTGALTALNVQGGQVRHAEDPRISADGGTAVFGTTFGFDPADTDGHRDPYAVDLATGAVQLLTLPTTSQFVGVHHHGVSGDGRFVVVSTAEALQPADTNDLRDVYVVDRLTGGVERITVALQGGLADADSIGGPISADGRFVPFQSRATNLVPGDTNATDDVFLRDRVPAASVLAYGTGLGGTNGVVPAFGLLGLPVLGTAPALVVGNPSGVGTIVFVVLGTQAIAVPTPVVGTLLASPDVVATMPIGATGLVLPVAIPNVIDLAGVQLHLQALVLDAGAPAGVAFTRGLAARIGG